MEGMELRVPTRKDEGDWRRLWTAYLDFYETKVPEEVYRTTWERIHSGGEFEPKCMLADATRRAGALSLPSHLLVAGEQLLFAGPLCRA